MGQHALLSASGASRWMRCRPSARLEQKFENTTSAYAREGTLAHEVGETLLRKYTGGYSVRKFNSELKKLKEDALYQDEILEYATQYSNFVIERLNEAKSRCSDPILMVEERVDFSEYVPEGFGTGDAVIISDGVLEIIDLKYGKGVPVYAENNPQMMLYGVGALRANELLYDIQKVTMTVFQPRLDNISSWTIEATELLEWAEIKVKCAAEEAFKGEGDFIPGDHCKFCKAKANCRARAEKGLELAKLEFKKPALLTDEEICEVLATATELKAWAGDIWDFAQNEALKGKKWDGFKLVEGRSNRVYADEKVVSTKLEGLGYKPDAIYNIKLKGIGDMEKALTKSVFSSLLGDLVIKPVGKPTLVEESDKREELSSAKSDFKVEQE